MKFSYNWLKDFLPKMPQPSKVAELLNMHAFEVEDVRKAGKDTVFDIDILPNRMADAASHLGIAHEIARIWGKQSIVLPKIVVRQGKEKTSVVKIKIAAPKACQRYSARVVTGLKVGPSPKWLKERLKAVGVGSINNIVDAANYVMLEYGQPLHAFDFDKIESGNPKPETLNPKQIVVRFAKKGEKILTLDGENRELTPEVLLIADSKKPLAIAGIKGGAEAGITNKTKNILIESGNFDPITIYRASRLLGIRSDASNRFEAGRPVEATLPALERVTGLIQELAGGMALGGIIDAGQKKSPGHAILLRPDYVSKLLGVTLSSREIRLLLFSVGCVVRPAVKGAFRVVPSPERMDIEREEDLIEEIGRLHGFGNIPPKQPHALLMPAQVPDLERVGESMRDQLTRLGFWEQENYAFAGPKLLEVFGLSAKGHGEVLNPVSEDCRYLRMSLLPRLIKNVIDNRSRASAVSFFEIGRVWQAFDKGLEETERLGLVSAEKSTGNASASAHPHAQAPLLFALKGAIVELCNAAGIGDVHFEAPDVDVAKDYSFLTHGRIALVRAGGTLIGVVGESSPQFYREGSMACAELYLNEIVRLASEEHEYRELPKYPEALRDIAVLVPKDVYTDEVAQEIVSAGKPLVRDVDLFDYYEGDQVSEDMKSLAFHIYYQAPNRTLTDAEVDVVHNKIEQALVARDWQVR